VTLCCVCGEKLTQKQTRYVRSPEGKRIVCELHEAKVNEMHKKGGAWSRPS
jgi:hypothetical protein